MTATVAVDTIGDCLGCGKPMVFDSVFRADPGLREQGYVAHSAHRRCAPCYKAHRRVERETRQAEPDPDISWLRRAACEGEDARLWFSDLPDEEREARAVCADCPVRAACLNWAITTGQEFGIWGGEKMAAPGDRGRCTGCDWPMLTRTAWHAHPEKDHYRPFRGHGRCVRCRKRPQRGKHAARDPRFGPCAECGREMLSANAWRFRPELRPGLVRAGNPTTCQACVARRRRAARKANNG